MEDLTWWIRQNRRMALRIMKLVEDIQRDPFNGIGKPELLKHELTGSWSRRLDREHRLVYHVNEQHIIIASCRFHYK